MSVRSIQKFFPFVPDYMSWDDWNGNLAIFYGELNVPFSSEDQWQTTAHLLSGNTAFASYPIPNPDRYEEWQQWARDFVEIVNGQSY